MAKFNKSIYPLLLALLFLTNSIAGAQVSQQELENKVDAIYLKASDASTPGSAVLVVKDGEIVLNKGYGLANLEHEVPVTPHTVFDLASLSKQFTGYAIALLIEQGKISADDDIRKYIPELADFGHTIKISHLVHHTSGIRDWTSTLPLAGWSFDDVISFDQILRMAYAQNTLNFVPGSEYTYSNTGYNLLAELIQRVTGSSFADWMDKNIFKPLEMTSTFFLDDHTEVIPERASGYRKDSQGQFHVSPNNLTALGSSSMYSTTTDLAKWVMHLSNPGEEKKPVVDRMYQQGVLNNGKTISYAYGITVGTFRNTKWIAHSGGWASFSTYLVLLPEYNTSVVVLNNNPRSAYEIAREIASLYVPKPSEEGDRQERPATQEKEIAAEVLEDYTGMYHLGTVKYLNITLEGRQLWVQATDEAKYPMTAVSDSVFTVEGYGGRAITFRRDQSAKVTHLEYNKITAPKMNEHSAFSLNKAKDYLGEYYSDELNTTYTVISEGGKLMFRHFRHGDINLKPVWNDDFLAGRWFIRSVEFKRDENGEVAAFYITTTRAKKQRFVKLHKE